MFHQDIALYMSLVTNHKLLYLGINVLIPVSYSPDFAYSDYHLFRSFQNSLNGKNFGKNQGLGLGRCEKSNGEDFISQKTLDILITRGYSASRET